MTETARPRRYRRTARTLSALRQLAREAAEAGEPLAAIAARLDIPPTTLSDWALADGFRKTDLKAKAAAAAAAETEADRVRHEAEEMVREAGLDTSASPVKREVDMARARVGALLDAGHIRGSRGRHAQGAAPAQPDEFCRAGVAGPQRRAGGGARGARARLRGAADAESVRGLA
tara:strand:- start:3640 stop:4164 length:525 start_codon:yes stop_codon:yes gene_type:complete